jgi:hypothetical protein
MTKCKNVGEQVGTGSKGTAIFECKGTTPCPNRFPGGDIQICREGENPVKKIKPLGD